MKFALFIAVFMPLAQASTPSVRCTLSSADLAHSQQVALEAGKENMELSDSGYVHDLSFDLISTCDDSNCQVDVTFYSGKIEDEVGQTGWSIDPKKQAPGVFFSEKLEEAADGRDYRFECEFLK